MTTFTDDQPRAYTPAEVQEEFFGHIAYMVPYWVYNDDRHFSSLESKISGLMHSFYVTLTGCAEGFDASVDMRVHTISEAAQRDIASGRNFFPVGAENAVDINDGSLQYHHAEKHLPAPVQEVGAAPRQWSDAEMRTMLFNRVADYIHNWDEKVNVSDLDKARGVVRDIFVLCEGEDPAFPAKIDLIATPHPDDKEYRIGEGENYFEPETNLATPELGLVQAWDVYSRRFDR